MKNIKDLIAKDGSYQNKSLFWDRDVYNQELEKIFAKCWLFISHETLLKKPGDFIVTNMAEDEVVLVRQKDNSLKVFLNSCSHRGNQVCAAEAGNAKSFVCNYHGWSYGIDGKLVSVPFENDAYGESFDKCKLGLREIPKVESYYGFIFACMDPDAPDLKDYLGEMAWYMEAWASIDGGIEFLGPPSRSILNCNWKIPAENFVGDTYHVGWTHASALKAMGGPATMMIGNKTALPDEMGMQVTTRHGHGFGALYDLGPALLAETCPEIWEWHAKRRGEIEGRVGEWRAKSYSAQWNASIFPNCSFLLGTNVFKLWNPMGPNKIEVFTWAFAEGGMPEELKDRIDTAVHRVFGTAGMFEADDGDNFEYATRLNRGYLTRQGVVNSQMGAGDEYEVEGLPGLIGKYNSETCYRGFYRFYSEVMRADSWAEIEKNDDNWKKSLQRRSR